MCVPWVGGVMAVYGAADAIVSICCQILASLLDLYTKACGSAQFIFTTLNIAFNMAHTIHLI